MMLKLPPPKKIVIIDYGVGNLYSLIKAFSRFRVKVRIAEETEQLKQADAIVLPGVGAFQAGMKGLAVRGLIKTIKELAETGKPILGICLGAQLLMSEGYEFGRCEGLNIIPGQVVKFEKISEKIPHIGWNEITPPSKKIWPNTILSSVKERSQVYFVHSYLLKPTKPEHQLAYTDYGGVRFCSAIRQGQIYGTQFHPEKSGPIGLQIINNFIKLI